MIEEYIDTFKGPKNLITRTYNALCMENITSFEQITKYTEADMLKIPNFGRKSLNILKIAMAEKGLSFKPSRFQGPHDYIYGLELALRFYRDNFVPTKDKWGALVYAPTEELLHDCGNKAREALK